MDRPRVERLDKLKLVGAVPAIERWSVIARRSRLGADAFIVFYGLRYTLSDGELDAAEQRTDHRVIAARRVKLQTYLGRLTDGEPHFLLVGTRLGVFGVENESARSIGGVDLQQI